MSLDDQIADFLATADDRPPQSKLEPYADLIRGLRQRRWTYRKIAAALRERFGLATGKSSIHDFVRVRARRPALEPPPGNEQPAPPPSPTPRKRRFHLDM
ncbi:MAG: hypothetical protein WCG63_04330 [Opitutaceae bacterium]